MTLPSLNTPTYKTTLPITKKEVIYRPYLTKEEKIMLMAYESESNDALLDGIAQIIKNCCGESIGDPLDLPECDLEYIFIRLRSASVGEMVAPSFKCSFMDKESDCNGMVLTGIDFSSLEPTTFPDHNNTIILDKDRNIGVVLRYLTLNDVKKLRAKNIEKPSQLTFEMLKMSIDYIFDAESTYYAKDTSDEELTKFVESFNAQQLKLVMKFFDTSPTLQWTGKGICTKCGKSHDITLKGLTDFFM